MVNALLRSESVHQHATVQIKKCLEETKLLCGGCSKAEPKLLAPLQTPFPGAQDGQNLINQIVVVIVNLYSAAFM